MELDTEKLIELGWSSRWEALFAPYAGKELVPGRVIRSDRGSALVGTPEGVVRAKASVRFAKATAGPAELPVVGDWVVMDVRADSDAKSIEAVLTRSSAVSRGGVGNTSHEQVLAANVDVVFVVHPIAASPNRRRIERELALAWNSGAVPVIVLTKADLSPDLESAMAEVADIAFGVDVLDVNALDGTSAGELLKYLSGHRTAVMIGPSGAGKSTLTNALVGEQRQMTKDVRVSDGRGRHTTVARELFRAAEGGIIIDTPGLRALTLTGAEEGIAATFPDIEELAVSCRFRDCSHQNEPGCAVRAAVEAGTLPADRLQSYHDLGREARLAASKTDSRLRAEENRKAKIQSKVIKNYHKLTGKE